MLVGRAVAAQRRAALLAGAQMHPLRADLHALGELPALAVSDGADCLEMNAACVGQREPRLPCKTRCITRPGLGRTTGRVSCCQGERSIMSGAAPLNRRRVGS